MWPNPQFSADLVTFTYLLKKSLTENFIFCAVLVIGWPAKKSIKPQDNQKYNDELVKEKKKINIR